MDSVFQELKRAREAKKLSLLDVADATLINPSFLEAIEKGNTNILPQTYVRAFIREYASVVGLNPAAIMQQYDKERSEAAQTTQTPPVTPAVERKETKEPDNERPTGRSPNFAKFGLPVLVLVIIAVVFWNLTRTKPPQTNETPFDTSSEKALPDTSVKSPTVLPAPKSATPDSLTLKATTTDSVWVQIMIDDLAPKDYLFRANRTMTWRARNSFRFTTGNAGAVHLTLNDKSLGPTGKPGAVTRNLQINRQTLQK